MKGRPKAVRKISFMPAVSGFKPYGGNTDKSKRACVFLFYEEYESLRLSDYERLSQCEASQVMQVSRPTFTRIYRSAREKIAKAFVEGLQIVVEGGKVELDGNWFVCKKCKAIFSHEQNEPKVCALCGSDDIESYCLPESSEEMEKSRLLRNCAAVSLRSNPDTISLDTCGSDRVCRRRNCRKGKSDGQNIDK